MANNKKPSTLINMVVALLVITAVSGGVLGLVYGMTKDAIAEVDQKKNEAAIKAVLPLENVTYVADTLKYNYEGVDMTFPCNLAYDANGNFQGAAVKTNEGGFGGKIDMMVGFAADGTIKGTSVLSHSETPGLGANMTGKFKDQFVDKNPANYKLTVTKDGGDVDAITAATITSRAFSKAVDKAYKAFEANKAQFMNNAPVEIVTPDADVAPAEENNETMEGGQDNE
jgi:electron transport complex protein RnfG